MYPPLLTKTDNSLLTSIIKIPDLIKKAHELELATLVICDNNMYGAMSFYLECKKNNIKPIIGLEIIVSNLKLFVYAMNNNGYHNLIHLATNQALNKLDITILKEYANDLIIVIPYQSIELLDELQSYFSNVFLGYNNNKEREELNNYHNLVYINEIKCLNQEDLKYLKYLDAIKDNLILDQVENEYVDNYLIPIREIENKEDIENHHRIIELCNLEIKFDNNLLPIYDCPDNMDSYSYLKQLCLEGLKRIFHDKVGSKYIERLKYELNVINKMGFCNYFLIVYDYVKYAKENGILVGPGRGSAAGSLVAYCLNITTVDPLKYNLLFERFLNPERISMPDIDIDFEGTRRNEVVDYCINKYGSKCVAGIITFGTLGSKQAIRDVGRVKSIKLEIIDMLCKSIDANESLINNYNKNKAIKDLLNGYDLKEVYKCAMKLEGLKRHTSVHAAGIVMANTDLDNIIPLIPNNDYYITGYSMEYLEKLGLLKMDFLVLRNLTLINNILKDINISFDDIEENDIESIKIFKEAKTLGIFQFESPGMMKFLKKLQPNNFKDIYDAIALYRPGPMDNIDRYIRRRKGIEPINYIHHDIESILNSTYGIIIYQEQIMEIAKVMAGYTLAEADVLRRAMSKKKEEVLIKEKTKFINGCIEKGYETKIANELYELILKFASYGFNKAHSVVYAMISYKMAYLKAHYKEYFMKHLLMMSLGSELKTKEYIYEAKSLGIRIEGPSINESDLEYKIIKNKVKYPLTGIKGIPRSLCENIINQREDKPFLDIFDFMKRCFNKYFKIDMLQSLILSGCFDTFGDTKKTLYNNAPQILNYGELYNDLGEYTLKPELVSYDEYSQKELLEFEISSFGFYLSNHPVTIEREKEKAIPIIDIPNYFNKYVCVVGYIERINTTKSSNPLCFINISDEQTTIDIVLKNQGLKMQDNLFKGNVIKVTGLVEKRYDKYQILASKIDNISK